MTRMARRERQLVEIAALVVNGQHERAADLACEHKTEFPNDEPMLASLLKDRTLCSSEDA